MIDCLILGDSIAQGTHQYRRDCEIVARSGINSHQFNQRYAGEFFSGIVIISLGSNDYRSINTRKELETLRSRVLTKHRVYWILPAGTAQNSGVSVENIQMIIRDIAEKNGDIVLPIKRVGVDGIHPTGQEYRSLAANIR